MARNKLAGRAPSYDKRGMSKQARERKKAYDRKFSARPEQKKKRVETNRENRRAGTYGNGDRLDMSHTKSGKLVKEPQSKNRSRNGMGKGGTRKSTKK